MKKLAIFTLFLSSATLSNAQLLIANEAPKEIDSLPIVEPLLISIPLVGNIQLKATNSYVFQQALMAFQVDSLVIKDLPKETENDTLKSTERTTKNNMIFATKTKHYGGINP